MTSASAAASSPLANAGTAPRRAGLVLTALILAAGVANMNLSVANVTLPDVAKQFDASQIGLNLVAVGFSLGLSISVLYLGAIGDRYGRKFLLLLGLALSIPTAIISALSGDVYMLMLSRLLGGVAAGMAYPTTLALITALWSGHQRTKAIALWSALGAALSALSPMTAGFLMQFLPWGYSYLIAIPFAVIAILIVWILVPAHVNESTEKVDHLGGILSVFFIGALVISINFIAMEGQLEVALISLGISAVAGILFFWRQKRAESPLFDLRYAKRPTFWVAAVGGIIVFGSLMAAMYVGMQFLQEVLGYSALMAGLAILPCPIFMVIIAPFSGGMVLKWGSRNTLLLGFAISALGFLAMLLLWNLGSSYVVVGLAYALVGIGVGIAGTPASHALTDSVPVEKVGMASGTGDLQRDLGGSIMQSLLGAILSAGYSAAVMSAIADAPANVKSQITQNVQNMLVKSFASAEDLAAKYPQYQQQIIHAAEQSFLQGANWAYLAGIISMIIGAALVFIFFPKKSKERALYVEWGTEQ